MDTSETYIKMCDREEIQGNSTGPPEFNSYFYHATMGIIGNQHIDPMCFPEDYTWLPRQDQIQEMVLDNVKRITYPQLCAWDDFMRVPYAIHPDQGDVYAGKKVQVLHFFKSFEQLWLAFYMDKEHGKKWDGEKWSR